MGGQQLYQYRLILAGDNYQLNVGTDMDFNLEAELRSQLTESVSSKVSAVVRNHFCLATPLTPFGINCFFSRILHPDT